jgi:adenosine deaminase
MFNSKDFRNSLVKALEATTENVKRDIPYNELEQICGKVFHLMMTLGNFRGVFIEMESKEIIDMIEYATKDVDRQRSYTKNLVFNQSVNEVEEYPKPQQVDEDIPGTCIGCCFMVKNICENEAECRAITNIKEQCTEGKIWKF